MLLHVVVLVALGLLLNQPPSGTRPIDDRPIGIAMVHRLPDRDRYVDAADLERPPTNAAAQKDTNPATPQASLAAAPPASVLQPIDLAGILQEITTAPSPVTGTGMAGIAPLDGDAFAASPGQGPSASASDTTTMVFGVSGSGSRFVYVFDRSDSMNGFGGRPLRAAKRELIRSLQSLNDRQQFQLIFYNDKPTPFRMSGIPLQMMAGEEINKIAAARYIDSIVAYGGTEHESPLRMALRLAPT